MAENENYQKLFKIVAEYLPDDVLEQQITPKSNLTNELNINSANLVDIIIDVEEAFGITLENEDMDNMETVSDALDIINKKISAHD